MGIRTISTYDDLTTAEKDIVDTNAKAAMANGMHPDQHRYDHNYVMQYPGDTYAKLEHEALKERVTSFLIIPDLFHIMRESARRILEQDTPTCEEELPVEEPFEVVA